MKNYKVTKIHISGVPLAKTPILEKIFQNKMKSYRNGVRDLIFSIIFTKKITNIVVGFGGGAPDF